MQSQLAKPPSKGFVIVASKKIAFYYSAINLIESIRDYYPDAQFALFTEERFVDHRCKDDPNIQLFYCNDHIRAKLYGMANSPFDITFYMDADCEVEHEDIVTIWEQLEDNDLVFVELTKDKRAQGSFVEVEGTIQSTGDRIDLVLCGGVCLYNNKNPLVKEFMKDWWVKFQVQEKVWNHQNTEEVWWPEGTPRSMLRWDQFTLWWMTNKESKYNDLKIGRFKDNYRWNWFTSFKINPETGKHNLVDKPPIVIHHSASMKKDAVY